MSGAHPMSPPIAIADLASRVGGAPFTSRWFALDQARIDAFAAATEDRQLIHVDPVAARSTPFGGTIAHGFLTLSLLAPITQRLHVSDAALSINYGLDRVRFPAPLAVGARFRGAATIDEVTQIEGGAQVKLAANVEVDGQPKPALVAECLLRFYT